MSRKQFLLLAALMVTASLIGGALASKLLAPRNAYAQDQGEVIKANRLIIVDENGTMKASLSPKGLVLFGSGVVVCDEKGNSRAGLQINKNASSVILLDEAGTVRTMAVASKELSGIQISNAEGKGIWYAP